MTPTFERILSSERERHPGNDKRAHVRAIATYGFLALVPTTDKPLLPIAERTIQRRRISLRAAGLSPISTPEDLAQIAVDVAGPAPCDQALVRLLWFLNEDESRAYAAAATRLGPLVEATRDLLPTPPPAKPRKVPKRSRSARSARKPKSEVGALAAA
jgi:hypothetical protein